LAGGKSRVFATACVATSATMVAWIYTQEKGVECANAGAPKDLSQRVAQLEMDLAGKTNAAFVFIKPHACNDKVKALVREHFKSHGIRVMLEGTLDAETIDKELLIDTHYGAIASKAVKLSPKELNVPDKGKEGFKKMFGLSWEDALASGKVLNAKEACAKLGVDGNGMEAKWAKLDKSKDMIKFGGGFYCGNVEGLFVINGFYMSMRNAYTSPPAKIHYFTVQWPTDTLSWKAFRDEVLGATDPTVAATGSARRRIYENYQSLDLPGQPNTGDNGVHASASPFEALAERANWLKQPIENDFYGRGLMAAGIPPSAIATWCNDPQVTYEGKKGSLFDYLEDLDADTVISRAQKIS